MAFWHSSFGEREQDGDFYIYLMSNDRASKRVSEEHSIRSHFTTRLATMLRLKGRWEVCLDKAVFRNAQYSQFKVFCKDEFTGRDLLWQQEIGKEIFTTNGDIIKEIVAASNGFKKTYPVSSVLDSIFQISHHVTGLASVFNSTGGKTDAVAYIMPSIRIGDRVSVPAEGGVISRDQMWKALGKSFQAHFKCNILFPDKGTPQEQIPSMFSHYPKTHQAHYFKFDMAITYGLKERQTWVKLKPATENLFWMMSREAAVILGFYDLAQQFKNSSGVKKVEIYPIAGKPNLCGVYIREYVTVRNEYFKIEDGHFWQRGLIVGYEAADEMVAMKAGIGRIYVENVISGKPLLDFDQITFQKKDMKFLNDPAYGGRLPHVDQVQIDVPELSLKRPILTASQGLQNHCLATCVQLPREEPLVFYEADRERNFFAIDGVNIGELTTKVVGIGKEEKEEEEEDYRGKYPFFYTGVTLISLLFRKRYTDFKYVE